MGRLPAWAAGFNQGIVMRILLLRAACAAFLAMPVFGATTTTASAASESCLPSSLRARLAQVRSQFGPIRVISTHRPGARIAGSGRPSYHASCRAVDFVPPPGRYGAVAAWLQANHGGGVGTYSSGHIHIDDGAYVRFHRGGGGSYVSSGGSSRSARRGGGSGRYASNGRSRRVGGGGGGYVEPTAEFRLRGSDV